MFTYKQRNDPHRSHGWTSILEITETKHGIRTHASQSGLVTRNYRLSYEATRWERGKCLTVSFATSELSLANVLTSNEYVNDIPTNPLMILSLLKTANNPANNIKQLPRNSRRTASHLWRQWKQCINYPHLKQTPWIKWTQFLSQALSPYIYCETKLYSTDTSITCTSKLK